MNHQPPPSFGNITKSKRIASNTLVLFGRMIVVLIINLYTVRLVLQSLGEQDYGIFNAIAGVVLTSTFITTTLAVSFQRFFSYALGQKSEEQLNDIFSASINIVLLLAVIILVVFETVGYWFIQTHMNFPEDRMTTALWIFHFSLLAFVFGIIQLPYTAAIFSHEDMGLYAAISLSECFGKLLVAFSISFLASDGLFYYGAGLLGVAFIVFLLYSVTGRTRYPECRYKRVKEKKLHKDIISFSGWTMYGTMAGIAIIQGNTILLNISFGPVANAAYGIANQVYNAAHTLCNSVVLAFRPAMIKSYAERNNQYLMFLFDMSNKAIYYLMLCVSLPLIFEMETIFTWWLPVIPKDSVIFAQLFLIYMTAISMSNPITTLIQANGQVRNYYLLVDSITLLTLPITWYLFHRGLPAYFAFVSMIVICLLSHFVRLIYLKHFFPTFSIRQYFLGLVVPALVTTILSCLFTYLIGLISSITLIRFIAVLILSPLCTLSLMFLIGLRKEEKQSLIAFIRQLAKH